MIKTHYTTPSEVDAAWHVIDAEGAVLGRLATKIATILRGKHKPIYSQSVDTGDHVVVVNAKKLVLTRNKGERKVYRHHTGYPGGLKETSFNEMLEKHPERVIEAAVRGMLPKTRLGRAQFKKLKIYAGSEHKHTAQNPQPLEI